MFQHDTQVQTIGCQTFKDSQTAMAHDLRSSWGCLPRSHYWHRQSRVWYYQSFGGSSTQTSHKNQSSTHVRSGTRQMQKICRQIV